MDALRVMVVDDSALFRTLLRNVLSGISGCEVIASVGDGQTAIEKILELQPDLVTLDVEMPGVSGIEVLRGLKQQRCRTKILMVSRHTSAGAQVTTDALLEGAFDFILKPSGADPAANKRVLQTELQSRIAALQEVSAQPQAGKTAEQPNFVERKFQVAVIGCSTGGPDALAQIIPMLPGDLPVPLCVVQHMPSGFTKSLATRLNEASELEVFEAEQGASVKPGQAVIARGGSHLELQRDDANRLRIQLTDQPAEHGCRPAVDYTLRSAVKEFGGDVLAIILTGMGRDGTEGCRSVSAIGGHVIAQHMESCTVYGMPKSVIEAGLAKEIVPLDSLAKSIHRRLRRSV